MRVDSTQTVDTNLNPEYRKNVIPFVIIGTISKEGEVGICGPNFSPINCKDTVEELGNAEISLASK